MGKLVTVDLDLTKPCWERFNLDLKREKRGHVWQIQKLWKNYENIYGPIISNTGNFSFFENRDSSWLLLQVGKSILRQETIKSKVDNRQKSQSNPLYFYSVKPDWCSWRQPLALWTSEFEIEAKDKTSIDGLIKGKVPEQEIL